MKDKKKQLEPELKQWSGLKLGKQYIKAVLSLCLFNLCEEYIMQNVGLDESQAGIKVAGEGNGNPLQCACLENSVDRGA